MKKEQLKKIIDVAMGRVPADLVLKNASVIDIFNDGIIKADIAISDEWIAGIGSYEGEKEIDASDLYASPGLIDSHIHIESSYLTPEEFGRLVVPHGTTTLIADPHEIVNVNGFAAMEYMIKAGERTALDIRYMFPSSVPATDFETAGAHIRAKDMKGVLERPDILGFGEFMNSVGVFLADDESLDKLMLAHNAEVVIDGHSPGLKDKALNAYIAAGIKTDHECTTIEEMNDRISRGMYVLLRQGSASHDLEKLVHGVSPQNYRRCLLCSDDRQPKTIFEHGHLEHHLRICREAGLDVYTSIKMASLNAAECYRLYDRGALAPGLRADIVLFENLEDFQVKQVFIACEEVARDGEYLPEVEKYPTDAVSSSMHVKDYNIDRLNLKLKSDKVHAIKVLPGGVDTRDEVVNVRTDEDNNFIFDPKIDIAKIAVVERHQETGNVAVALLKDYGIKLGAIALSIAHDSHNIICVGTNDIDMDLAIRTLIEQEGGFVLTKEAEILRATPLPVAGLMTDRSAEWINSELEILHDIAISELKVSKDVDPLMTLCFMALPVIPELKITDKGLFDVVNFEFIDIEA
ncbi:MAG: adenine deaminase [Eubacteriales bacterium]|nr:adenine deaminase [Eubacteriales bacterium]MDD4541509.1 adenine deaminase [Eubacteriales bacterium]